MLRAQSPITPHQTSTSHGHTFAFGNTEARALKRILGTKASGPPSDPPFDPLTGRGHIKHAPGDYRDALSKHNAVIAFIMEPLGGIGRHGVALLKRIARIAASPAGRDGTVYHHTCRSFLPHHARRIVRSAVLEDARAMHEGLRRIKSRGAFCNAIGA